MTEMRLWLDISVYLHLTLRCLFEGSSPVIFLLAFAAGTSHALQGAAADYYRGSYLYFATSRARKSVDSSCDLRSDYSKLTWRHAPWQKLLLASYLNFTRQQETLAPRYSSALSPKAEHHRPLEQNLGRFGPVA